MRKLTKKFIQMEGIQMNKFTKGILQFTVWAITVTASIIGMIIVIKYMGGI